MKKLLLGLAAVCLTAPIFAQSEVVKDPATYEAKNGYTFENLWIKSVVTENNMTELVGGNRSRGMTILGDELLYSFRADWTGIKVYDLKTGEAKRDIQFDLEKFKITFKWTQVDTVINAPGDTTFNRTPMQEERTPGFMCNDIQVDDAGHVIVFNMSTGLTGEAAALWTIDMATGEPTKIMELTDADGLLNGYRVDYFAVKGDVTKDAIVMFAPTDQSVVIRCDIKDGQLVAQTEGDYVGYNFNVIPIQAYAPENAGNNGTGPRISIVDDEYFYLDGFNSGASLYDMSGSLIESVYGAPAECAPVNVGNNGVTEFTLNDKPFCAYVVSNTAATPAQTWNVIEMGEGPTFAGATYYWTFPKAGMGANTNAVRTALPRICKVVDKNGREAAYIAVYAEANGTAVYKMTPDEFDEESEELGVEDVAANNVNIYVAGDAIHFSGVADAVVYNFAGQQVSAANGVQTMAAPAAKGIYIVKAVIDGVQKVQKVVVK